MTANNTGMGKNKDFLCFVHDCIKRNECDRYRSPEYDALCLSHNSKHCRWTENDFSCFLKKCEVLDESN